MTTDSATEWRRLAAQLARMPDLMARLSAAHRDDGAGYCTACTTPGRGTHNTAWPCSLTSLVREARRAAQ